MYWGWNRGRRVVDLAKLGKRAVKDLHNFLGMQFPAAWWHLDAYWHLRREEFSLSRRCGARGVGQRGIYLRRECWQGVQRDS
jgi:hypothetical protein